MAENVLQPFSARNRGAQAQIDNACPETTRTGLVHLLYQLVELKYIAGWKVVVAELQRISRVKPDLDHYGPNITGELLAGLSWDKVFDFCERIHNHLAQEVTESDFNTTALIASKSAAQGYIACELQRLFLEENLAFEFSEGLVRRRGRNNTVDRVTRAGMVLGDPRLSSALIHFNKALRYFRNPSEPDYENAVKEAVCAVEATARALFPSGGSTLGKVVKSITGSEPGHLPKMIADTFHGLYGFGNGGEGVRHGGATGGAVTKELAEYSLALASSQIVLLVDSAKTLEPDIPF